MKELMNKFEKRKSETGDANIKLQIAVVKKFLQQQAEEKRQSTEAKRQPAQPQSTGTSWGWLGSALNSRQRKGPRLSPRLSVHPSPSGQPRCHGSERRGQHVRIRNLAAQASTRL